MTSPHLPCAAGRFLVRLEDRYRERLKREESPFSQLACGQIALEVQKERFRHEEVCLKCRAQGRTAEITISYRTPNRARKGGPRWIA
jgi:hypothetical protein